MFSAVREQKKLEVRGRGLMSFPQDSVQDIEGIQAVAAILDDLESFKDFTSPTTGLKLVVDRHFSAQMLYYFLVGDYEQNDFELIGKHLRQDDVVLELGGGVGLTGALIGQVTGQRVTICEPNPVLAEIIRRTFAINQCSLRLLESAAVNDACQSPTVEFHLSADYWWSSLLPLPSSRVVSVNAIQLSDLLALTRPNVLVVDIEGYETQLFKGARLTGIETIIIEIHAPSIGAQAASEFITGLIQQGFALVDFAAQSFVFKRMADDSTRWSSAA